MKTPVHRDLERLGPIVDRLADIAIALHRGHITDEEFAVLRRHYKLLLAAAWQ